MQRFSLSYFYKKDSGHTAVVLKENGKLRMYDPQTNTMFKGRDFLEELKEHGKFKNRLFRLDDKLPMSNYAGGIMKEYEK